MASATSPNIEHDQASVSNTSKRLPAARPHVAVFDYFVTQNSPSGKCLLQMVEALSEEYDITVFAVELSQHLRQRVRWIRVPAMKFPLLALFVSYHIFSSALNLLQIFIRRRHYELAVTVESNTLCGRVVYAHFCHSFYRQRMLGMVDRHGLAGLHKALNHAFHALCEPLVFARAKRIVVPSDSLKNQIAAVFPRAAAKIRVIPNAVEVPRMHDLAGSRTDFRRGLGFQDNHLVLIFVALGNFEHKGLSILLESLVCLEEGNDDPSSVRLLVVGGNSRSLNRY